MDPIDRAEAILVHAEALNTEVRGTLDTMKLSDARKILAASREIRGWMSGIEMLLRPESEEP